LENCNKEMVEVYQSLIEEMFQELKNQKKVLKNLYQEIKGDINIIKASTSDEEVKNNLKNAKEDIKEAFLYEKDELIDKIEYFKEDIKILKREEEKCDNPCVIEKNPETGSSTIFIVHEVVSNGEDDEDYNYEEDDYEEDEEDDYEEDEEDEYHLIDDENGNETIFVVD
jgi:hypothetical protein